MPTEEQLRHRNEKRKPMMMYEIEEADKRKSNRKLDLRTVTKLKGTRHATSK